MLMKYKHSKFYLFGIRSAAQDVARSIRVIFVCLGDGSKYKLCLYAELFEESVNSLCLRSTGDDGDRLM